MLLFQKLLLQVLFLFLELFYVRFPELLPLEALPLFQLLLHRLVRFLLVLSSLVHGLLDLLVRTLLDGVYFLLDLLAQLLYLVGEHVGLLWVKLFLKLFEDLFVLAFRLLDLLLQGFNSFLLVSDLLLDAAYGLLFLEDVLLQLVEVGHASELE